MERPISDADPLFDPAALGLALDKYVATVKLLAAEKYAPLGHTQALRNSIDSDPAAQGSDGNWEAAVYAFASGADGEYAVKQHEEELGHVANPPAGRSFTDFGEGGHEARYWSGYRRARASGNYFKYATKFFDKAEQEAFETTFDAFFGEALK